MPMLACNTYPQVRNVVCHSLICCSPSLRIDGLTARGLWSPLNLPRVLKHQPVSSSIIIRTLCWCGCIQVQALGLQFVWLDVTCSLSYSLLNMLFQFTSTLFLALLQGFLFLF